MSRADPTIRIAGEDALIIYFGERPAAELIERIRQAATQLERTLGDALVDLVPAYTSLLVLFDPERTDPFRVRRQIQACLAELPPGRTTNGRLRELPVYYHPETGPDLERLTAAAGLEIDDVIRLHQSIEYRVYAIGFAPGFAYLGEVDERIAMARLATPRLRVPRGTVGIADRQTAVYPAASPGGWNLIGNCPVAMFDPDADPPIPLEVGDRVRFRAIDRAEFLALGGRLESVA